MIYLKTANDLENNIKSLYDKPRVSVDCETGGFSPFKDDLTLLQLSDKDKTVIINVREVGLEATAHYVRPILESKNTLKLLHNAKFDTKFIKQQLKVDVERVFDTMLASMILEAGIKQEKGFHSLGSCVKRYNKKEIDKSLQTSDWTGEISQAQLEYATRDVEELFPLVDAQTEYLKKNGLLRCAKLEFDAVLPVAWLELCGFYLDFDAWMAVANGYKTQADKIADEIFAEMIEVLPQQRLFGDPPFNLGSTDQVKKHLKAYGVPVPSSTKEEFLTPLIKDWPIVGKFIEWRGHEKSYTSFGENFREFINPVTGRIHADFFQLGAATGRFACSSPNLNQIPRDEAYRACFKPQSKENTLISADFSQEELRLLADFSKDENFQAVFSAGGDFHRATACTLFNIPPEEKVTSEQRGFAKTLNFGVVYGIGAKKFARKTGIPELEAMNIINAYFDRFKKVKRYLDYKQQRVLVDRYGRTASGRIARYEFDENDWWSRTSTQREAANLPLQGTGADILKRSLRVFYDNSKSYHDKIKLVNIVHDQMDVEAPKDIADEVQDVLVKSMVSAGSEFVTKVDIKVDSHQSEYWKKG